MGQWKNLLPLWADAKALFSLACWEILFQLNSSYCQNSQSRPLSRRSPVTALSCCLCALPLLLCYIWQRCHLWFLSLVLCLWLYCIILYYIDVEATGSNFSQSGISSRFSYWIRHTRSRSTGINRQKVTQSLLAKLQV